MTPLKSDEELNAMPLQLRLAWIKAWAYAAPLAVLNAELKEAVRA